MIAVIFEVEVKPSGFDQYLEIAAGLKTELEQIEGFISVERFQSLNNPEKLLSLSFWQDEKAVLRWRRHQMHQQAQKVGRSELFRDYRLRVAGVIRDYGMNEREQVPAG